MRLLRLRKTLGIAASAGGHLTEAVLAASLIGDIPRFYVTFKIPRLRESLGCGELHFVAFPGRRYWIYVLNFLQAVRIFLKTRPMVILTTGGGVAVPFCLIGKALGSRVVFVESGARVVYPSRASRVLYRLADLSIVQWRPLLRRLPGAVYGGPLL